jgi:hypothetical protein
MEDTGMC